MKKNCTFLMAAFALLVCMAMPLGVAGQTREEVVAYTLTPASGSNNSYAGNCDIAINGITWNLTGNSQMQPWRIGGKNLSGVDRTLYSKTAIADNITKIEVTHGSASSITVNSMTVIVASNSSFSSVISTLTPTFAANSTVTIEKPVGVDWTGCYYKFVYNVTVSGSSNKFLEFSGAKFYKENNSGVETYTVTYDCNGGTSGCPENVTGIASNTSITLADAPAKANYTFDGWSNGSQTYPAGASYPVTGNVTFTAQWTENSGSGGSGGNGIIDFENALSTYTDWEFDGIGTTNSDITAHDGEYYGSNINASGNGLSSATITTKETIAYPQSLSCYVSKTSKNTTASTWYIQVSSNGSSWTNVKSQSATSMSKGEWVEFTADLSEYTDVYVRIYYSGSTAVRAIDDIALTTYDPTDPYIQYTAPATLAYNATSGAIAYTVHNPIDGAGLLATSDDIWISDIQVGESQVTFAVTTNDTSSERTGIITLTYANGSTTLATAQVTVRQAGDPSIVPGTLEHPYTVPQALAVQTPADTIVYVAGIVSQIEHGNVVQYHNISYYISADGTTSNQLLARYGRNLDDSDFYSEDELQLGDRVVIRGKLEKSGGVIRIAQYNYLVSLERDVEPALFFPPSCMMVANEDALVYIYSDTEEAEIHYTMDGTTPTMDSPIFDENEPINLQNATGTVTIKAIAYYQGKHSAVTQAEYRMVPPGTPGTAETPYTVQQALDALDANSSISDVYVHGIICSDPEFELEQYMNANYYISDDGTAGETNQLYVYRGKGLDGEDITHADYFHRGDIVTVMGNLIVYHGTKEFSAYSSIYELEPVTSIVINSDLFVSDILTVDHQEKDGTLDVNYYGIVFLNGQPIVQFYDAPNGNATICDWITVTMSESTSWDINFHIDANTGDTPRTAYLRVIAKDANNQDVYSNLVTIIQNESSEEYFASLPFYFYGNEEEEPQGLTANGMDDDYYADDDLTFNGSGDYVLLKFTEEPGELKFKIKGSSSFSGSAFYVQTSADGIGWDNIAVYSTSVVIDSWSADDPRRPIAEVLNLSTMEEKTFSNLPSDVRYIKWVYTIFSKGSVYVDDISLEKPLVSHNIVLHQPFVDNVQAGTISADMATALPGQTVTLSVVPNDGYFFVEWNVLDANDNVVEETDNQFVMPNEEVVVEAVMLSSNTEYTYTYSINGVTEEHTANIGTPIGLPTSANLNEGTFTFLGWSTDATDVENVMTPGFTYTLMHDVTFYAVYVEMVSGSVAQKHYIRVTQDLEQNWAGDYMIAYSPTIFADGRIGGRTEDGAMGREGVSVNPGNNLHDGIIETTWADNYRVTLEKFSEEDNTYLLKTLDGKYNYQTSNANGLSATDNRETAGQYPLSIEFNSENDIRIKNAAGAGFRYNTQGSGYFRFYKDCGQSSVYLYKKTISTANRYTRVFIDNPTGSVVITGPSIIPSGYVLNPSSLTNELGADKLIIEEGGQLVTASSVNAKIYKNIVPYESDYDNYYLVSSPIDNQDPEAAGMTGPNFDLYYFDQSAQGEEWQNYKGSEFNLESGTGYLYANNYGGSISMAGAMVAASDDVNITKVEGKTFAGWNLIGNPYPCNVTINRPFFRISGEALATEATSGTIALAPMEAVFVCADGTEQVHFTKAPTVSTVGRGKNTLSLKVRRDNVRGRGEEDKAIVSFGEGGMLRKLVLNPNLTRLYVAQGGDDFAIVNAQAEGELPVSFQASENGRYILSVETEAVEMRYLHLIDNRTGADIDLLQTPSYTFEASTSDYACRFRLVFQATANADEAGDNANFAYYNGSAWVVNSEDNATLQVVDMMGHVLSTTRCADGACTIATNGLAQGVYMIRLLSGDNVKVQKIVIR